VGQLVLAGFIISSNTAKKMRRINHDQNVDGHVKLENQNKLEGIMGTFGATVVLGSPNRQPPERCTSRQACRHGCFPTGLEVIFSAT
jgi:hypothetical protein